MQLRSLEPIKRVIETGQRPLVVACSDFEDYFCKYPVGSPAQTLMTEWISAHAAMAAGIYTPPYALVTLHPEHLQIDTSMKLFPGARPDQTMFGSRHIKSFDMEKRLLNMLSDNKRKSKLEDRDQLLRIALFDIWLSNEDRHGNNYNMLLADYAKKLRWIAIDHGACFNTLSAINHGLTALTYEDSIISSELFALIFQKPANFVNRIHGICDELDKWRKNALQQIEQWLVDVPLEWGIDRNVWMTFLRDQWLSDKWTATTKQTFLEHTQLFNNP